MDRVARKTWESLTEGEIAEIEEGVIAVPNNLDEYEEL
jgi:hypothetical protein